MRSPISSVYILLAIPAFLTVVSCNQASQQPAPSNSPQGNAATPATTSGSRVTLAFDDVPLEHLPPIIYQCTAKTLTIDPQLTNGTLRPRYGLTLISSELITQAEACERIMSKLRSDGLAIEETEDTILIRPGNYQQVWSPPRHNPNS